MNLNPMKTMIERKTDNSHFFEVLPRLASIFLIVLFATVVNAQNATMVGILPSEKEVVEDFSVRAGMGSATDEYLSPNEYNGFSIGFKLDRMSSRNEKKMFCYSKNRSSLLFCDMKNKAGNGVQLEMAGSIVHVWEAPLLHYRNYDLLAGPSVCGSIDALYNLRNSNNPANVHGMLAAGLEFDNLFRFKVGRLPIALDASFNMPLTGIFFVPEYNLPYYLLFEERLYGKTIHFMSPFNVTCLYNDVAFFFPVGKNQLSLSMSMDCTVHNLGGNATVISHCLFGLGYVHRFEHKYNGR